MTLRALMQRHAKRTACPLVLVLVLSGCDRGMTLSVVTAVVAGVPSVAPFFDERSGLGQDAQVRSLPARGGLQQGDTRGLYGGSKQPTVCDVERLEQFLTDPATEPKSQAWARALGISGEGIPDYLERLTPVLLRHDTLVKNHDDTSVRRWWPYGPPTGNWIGSPSSTSTGPGGASLGRSARQARTTPPSTPKSGARCRISWGRRSGGRADGWPTRGWRPATTGWVCRRRRPGSRPPIRPRGPSCGSGST